jgi:4-methyl-5(b-hydroxyethyl)-thiazole monophosphate biosynthesis
VASDLPEIAPMSSIVCGNVVTSQGAGTAVDFGLQVVTALVGKDKASEVAKAICYGAPTA